MYALCVSGAVNTQGFVWKFFYALYINFHSFIHKYKVHKLHHRMYLRWSLCSLYLHACQVRVTVGDSGLCCCTCVTYFQRLINSLVG